MVQIVNAENGGAQRLLDTLRKRGGEVNRQVTITVGEIIEQVRQNGDDAVREYTRKFDGRLPQYYEVPPAVLQQAAQQCDPALAESLCKAAENIRAFHINQLPKGFEINKPDGSVLGQKVRGLDCVGIYVPGGTAAYPSSVLMNAIPAKIAGVRQIVMVTPPRRDGTPNPDILAAAQIAGVDRVFLCGGAQAVAALAFGTALIPKADKIVGPGNMYVATAKKLLYGTVDIDMIAGPSEILILADQTANPVYLAADMMSQAEHDRMASAILVTTDEQIAQQTVQQLRQQSAALSRREIIEASLRDFGAIIVCDTMEQAVAIANDVAPEHLEICAKNPMQYLAQVRNAGSVFLGDHSPEPLGDYFAGPNHVLPTSGTARFFSPLSVDSFLKRMQYIYYTDQALQRDAQDIIRLANAEGLTAHANSIMVRFGQQPAL